MAVSVLHVSFKMELQLQPSEGFVVRNETCNMDSFGNAVKLGRRCRIVLASLGR